MSYLVDTDILIDFLRQKEAAADYLDSLGDWSLSVVSGMELVAGALDKRRGPGDRHHSCNVSGGAIVFRGELEPFVDRCRACER